MIIIKTKLKLLIIVITVLSVTILGAIQANKGIDQFAETTVKNAVHSEVSDAIYEYVRAYSDLFADAVVKSFDKDGNLVCININAAVLNGIQTGVEKEILSTLQNINNKYFYLPLGSLTGIKLLSATGPKIKMKIAPLGTMSCDTINSFESVGINHSLHKVGLDYTISFSAAVPLKTAVFETKFTLLICETVVIGKVPQVYFS